MKIRSNVPVADEEKERVRWPFSDMKVGDCILVKDAGEWKTAVSRAHAFAHHRSPRWKFRCRWIEKAGRIRRIV